MKVRPPDISGAIDQRPSVRAPVLRAHPRDILAVEATAPDRFVGQPVSYPWGWLFGGHVVAQALLAAGATVDSGFVPHSVHASFLRKGQTSERVAYEVERARDGRSYCSRRVVGSQSGDVLVTAQASFAAPPRTLPTMQPHSIDLAPPPPDDLAAESWTTAFARVEVPTRGSGHIRWWYRLLHPVGDGPLEHAAALAFLSDDLPGEAVMDAHDAPPADRRAAREWAGASLDHSIWFHAPLRVDSWHLHEFRCLNYSSGRGLALGMIFGADGSHVATVSQEAHLVWRGPSRRPAANQTLMYDR